MAPTRPSYVIALSDETNLLTVRPFSEAERAPAGATLE